MPLATEYFSRLQCLLSHQHAQSPSCKLAPWEDDLSTHPPPPLWWAAASVIDFFLMCSVLTLLSYSILPSGTMAPACRLVWPDTQGGTYVPYLGFRVRGRSQLTANREPHLLFQPPPLEPRFPSWPISASDTLRWKVVTQDGVTHTQVQKNS